jgi:hypothetical protein
MIKKKIDIIKKKSNLEPRCRVIERKNIDKIDWNNMLKIEVVACPSIQHGNIVDPSSFNKGT